MDRKLVVISRSNPISPNPRVEKTAAVVAQHANVTVVGWDRTGILPSFQERKYFKLVLYNFRSPFGSGLKNFWRLLRWEFFLLRWILRHGQDISVFHACDFDTILPGMIGKFLFHYRLVYDICDFYADHIRNTPQWIIPLIRWMDRFAMQMTDAVILVDESRQDQLGGYLPKNLVFIYNTPMDCLPEMDSSSDLPAASFRIAYVGMLQKERGIFELIDVVSRHPDWRFDLAGFGGDEDAILEKAGRVEGLTWHGRVDYDRALQISNLSDVLIATYDPSIPNHRFSSPNKVFEAMMLAKPIIVARGMHIDQIVEVWEFGLVVTYGDREELDDALQKLASDRTLRLRFGNNARRAYDEKYSWKNMEERLNRMYSRLLDVSNR
jgi:glycosyltransferase involved in cell wall biosynthesis